MDRGLIRYWFEYDAPPIERGGPIVLDCRFRGPIGVTAFDLEDALALVRSTWDDEALTVPDHIVEDVDVSQLDDCRQPWIGVPIWRGVWYPRPSSI